MKVKELIEMAREAQLPYDFVTGEPINLKKLEAFAALVREDEAEKYKWEIHSCGPTCMKVGCVAMREAVIAEREACAKVCEDAPEPDGADLAKRIRARGTTPPAAQRTWVGLTDEEISQFDIDPVEAKALMAKLKEKNT